MKQNWIVGSLLAALLAGSVSAAGPTARQRIDTRAYELSLKGQNIGVPASTRASASYNNTTVGGPTYTRALSSCMALSGVGVGVNYHSQEFSVDTSGAHNISSVQNGGWDGFIFVYANAFNPANALANCVRANDDGTGGVGTSDIAGINLTAGTTYFLVTTGFDPTESGTFTNTISGPGNITIGPAGPQADLSITKTAPGGVVTGGNYTYALTAANAGPIDATAVVVTDVLPAGITFVSSTCGASEAAGTVTWTIGALANGASQSCTLTVNQASTTCVAIANTATIDGAEGDPNGGNSSSTSTNGGANVVADPSYEDGTPNGFWTEASTNFGTPICSAGACGGTGGGTGPNTGTFWAWFGGLPSGLESGSLEQSITIPSGAPAITFFAEFPVCNNGASDFVRLLIDGTQVWREDATSMRCGSIGYQQVTVPLTPTQANGAAHLVRFESTTIGGAGASNFFIDDVSIVAPPTCSAAPGVLSLTPTTVNFGTAATGSASAPRPLTISNTGTGALQVSSISAVTAPYTQVAGGTCAATPFTLAAGASCTVLYRFSPTTAGIFNQTVTVASNGGDVTANLTARGIVAIPLNTLSTWSTSLLITLLGLGSIIALRRRS